MTDTSKAIAFGAKTPDTIAPTDKRIEVRDLKYDGLRLVVQPLPSGKKSWAFRFRCPVTGDQYKATLGKWPGMTVDAAHKIAADYREQLANGKNPLHVPSHPAGADALAKTDPTIRPVVFVDGVVPVDDMGVMAVYDRTHISTLRKGTQSYVRRELNQAAAAWIGRDIKSIKKADVLAITDAAQKRGEHAKNQTVKTLQAFFRWVEEDRGLIENSPARGIRKIKVDERERVLSEGEIKVLWAKATEVNGPYGALVKLLLLTGCRRNEIARLEWSEVTADAICLPAHRTKTGEAFNVPLTEAMKDILATLPRRGRYVLGTRNANVPMSASNWAKQKLEGALNAEWRFHDLRRTFRTGLSKLKIRREVAEACLNHKLQGLEAIYNQDDFEAEKVEAFNKWSDHVLALTSDAVTLGNFKQCPIPEVVA